MSGRAIKLAWRPAVQPRRTVALPFLILAIGLAGTAAATWGFRRATGAAEQSRFANAVQASEDRIRHRLDTHLAVLLATRGLFAASDDVTGDEFHAFVNQLELARRYPGARGIGFSARLPGPGDRHAVRFLEPLDARNRAALGYDMATDPVRRDAMIRARDTGQPAASGMVTLVQEIDADKQRGFNIYVPVYRGGAIPPSVEARRAALLGYVYSPFRIGDLMQGVFGSEHEPRVEFEIHDGPAATAATLVYRSAPPPEAPRLATVGRMDVFGQTWTLRYVSLPSFERNSGGWLWPYVVGVGLVVSGLLFLLSRTQARVAEQLRLHARILESMSEGVTVTDEHGVILYTNQAEDRMFGYAAGELLGRSLAVEHDDPPGATDGQIDDMLAELHRKGTWAGELANVRKDGATFLTSARAAALPIGGRPYWVVVHEDITERKRGELERARLLHQESALREQAEAANRAKDEFLAMLGHELRNPLAPIVTALGLLARKDAIPRREHDLIERQVRHLARLVDDLLDVSRIARGKIALDRGKMELARAVTAGIEIASPLLEERRHVLVVDVPPSGLAVEGDEARLAQVVANLLTNAAKYTDPGGHITVSARREHGELVLRVRDDGIGIPRETIPRLFELFAQGERGLDRSQGGLGLGLTLVRSLVELHGGRVEAHSEGPGTGSEFVVHLPAAPPTGEAPAVEVRAPVIAPAPTASQRILVVDDNRDAADLLADVLREAGHEVSVAYDGLQALEVASETHPQIAVLDIGLPVMDGYEVAARIKAELDATLIAVTGYGQERDRARSAEAGFDFHLTKPVSLASLLATVDEAVRRPRTPS